MWARPCLLQHVNGLYHSWALDSGKQGQVCGWHCVGVVMSWDAGGRHTWLQGSAPVLALRGLVVVLPVSQ